MLSAYLPWLIGVAALVVLPVLLRLRAGEEPDNTIRQEQPPGGTGRPQDPGVGAEERQALPSAV